MMMSQLPAQFNLYDFAKDFQVLASAIVALIAATLGFLGVHLSNREALKREMLKIGHEKEALIASRKQKMKDEKAQKESQKNENRNSFINMIIAELSSNYKNLSDFCKHQAVSSKIIDHMVKGGMKNQEVDIQPYISALYKGSYDIYEHHCNKIDLLPLNTASSLVYMYGVLKGKQIDIPSENAKSTLEIAAGFQKGALEANQKLMADVHDLIMRLHCVRLGLDDPGEGLASKTLQEKGFLKPPELTRQSKDEEKSAPSAA